MDPNEILTAYPPELIAGHLREALKAAGRGVEKLKQGVLVRSGRAFSDYYDHSLERYGKTKTILYRTAAVPLNEFYVPLGLVDPDGVVVKTDHLDQVTINGQYIIITGLAGSGKSTLLKHLFLDTVRQQSYLPVYIEMRQLPSDFTSLQNYIYSELGVHGFDLPKDVFMDLLQSGKFVFFVDGFDEIEPDRWHRVGSALLRFKEENRKNIYIVTSRPDDRFTSWASFQEFEICPLSKSECVDLLSKLRYDVDVRDRFIGEVESGLYESHASFLSNPLLTTIMLMTYDQFGTIPNKMHLFYEQAFDTLFTKHDATKGGYKRHMFTGLASDEFRRLMSGLCIIAYLNSKTVFSRQEFLDLATGAKRLTGLREACSSESFLEDNLRSLCLILQDGFRYTFTHRTFQEYFAAYYIAATERTSRRRILRSIESRFGSDNTAQLAWEMNSAGFQDDFLIERLQDIIASVPNSSSGEREFEFIRRTFHSVVFSETGTYVAQFRKDGYDPFQVIVFATRSAGYTEPESPELRKRGNSFLWEVKRHIEGKKLGKLGSELETVAVVDKEGERPQAHSVDRLLTYDQVFEEPRLRQSFLHAVSVAERFRFAVNATEKMIEEQKSRKQSAEELLFPE